MPDKSPIREWAPQDRPRERMERMGPAALTNAELLAILIGSGTKEESAVDLMRRVLDSCGGTLSGLGRLTQSDLQRFRGVGPAKAVTILAACELGRRRQQEHPQERLKISNAGDVYNYMHPIMCDLPTEQAWIMLLNQSNRLIRSLCISQGGITQTAVDVRVIMREALFAGATVVVLCHNHPSGNTRPSSDDDRLTHAVSEACGFMRIFFLDHVIITDGNFYSYRDAGKI